LKTHKLERLVEKLEPWLLGIMLLYFLDINTHPLIVKAMKPGSYGILAILISFRWKRFVYIATRDIPLLLFAGMSAASILWSASPTFTGNEYKAAIRGTLLGIYLATRFSMKEQMRLWTWVLGIGAVLSLVLSLALPSYGIKNVVVGIYRFKNLAACIQTLTAILFLLVALTNRKYRWVALIIFSIAIVLLLLSQGKTAYSIFVISLCLLPLYKVLNQKYKLRIALLLPLLVVSGSAIVLIISNVEFIVVDTLGKNLEFNGRMPIWTLILDKVYERPWLGYGASGFWSSEHALYVINHSWGGDRNTIGIGEGTTRFNSHNGYLDLLLQYGFVGLSLYVFNWLSVFFRLVTLLASTGTIECFWMLLTQISLFFFNLSDNIGLLGQSSLWSFYVAVAFSTALQHERIRKLQFAKT